MKPGSVGPQRAFLRALKTKGRTAAAAKAQDAERTQTAT